MSQLALAGIVSAGAGSVYLVLGALWWLRDRADRRAAARLHEVEIDPYHAAAAGWESHLWWGFLLYEPAAAALLLDRLITIDPEGLMTVTARGNDTQHIPEHPVEAAVLQALCRSENSVTVHGLDRIAELTLSCESFLREQDARVPHWPGREQDDITPLALLTSLLLSFFYAVQVAFLSQVHPRSLGDLLFRLLLTLILGLVFAVPLVCLVVFFWPQRRDLFLEHCKGLPPHPAITAVDAEQRARLKASVAHREWWERAQQSRDIDRISDGGE